ncbi:MAG TPA: hypothetical protein VFV94_12030 [Polyangiaceae bacterium]|jgi:hypothetical protein|nr:hypothetical protein [Polyangiaceae bacterium]
MRTVALLLPALVFSCGPDSPPVPCNGGVPEFSVVIKAPEGPLPSDIVVKLYYGGRAPDDPEVLTVAEPMTPQALFCYPADKNGVYDASGPAIGSKPASAHSQSAGAGNGGAGGEGGAGGSDGRLEALGCDLYTDGSARLEVVTMLYGTQKVELALEKSVCTVKTTMLLEPMDAGME